jgi:hypothetical protein
MLILNDRRRIFLGNRRPTYRRENTSFNGRPTTIKEPEMTKLEITKNVLATTAGVCASIVVSTAIRNTVPVDTRLNKAVRTVGGASIGMVVADQVEKTLSQKFDKTVEDLKNASN